MNSKERAIRAIEREEPDRVPLEGTTWSEWSYPFLQKVLLPQFGLGGAGYSKEQLGEDLDILCDRLGIDFRGVGVNPSVAFQSRAAYDPLFEIPWGVRIGPDTMEDEWGVRRQLNTTRTQSRIVHHPLRGKESLDDYSFPDVEAPGRFDEAEKLVKKWRDEYAISANPHPSSDGFFLQAWYLRGFNKFIWDMHSNPKFVNKLLDDLLKIYSEAGKRFVEMGVDIICIPDDIAGQTGMILSPHLWRGFIKPRMRKLIQTLKKRGVYILYHSDGNLEPIIPDLIEIGVDILNPIQPECMDPAKIKRLYGDRLTLSGTISIQETLPRGTVEDVRREVITRIKTCGHDGGLFISPTNQVLLDTKIENFLAVYDTVKQFGRYPLKL